MQEDELLKSISLRASANEPWRDLDQLAQDLRMGSNGQRQDPDLALQTMIQSKDIGSPDAPFILANMYREGLGVVQDNRLALDFYKVAAERGNYKAYPALAHFLFEIDQIDDSKKCWERFFEHMSEIEEDYKVQGAADFVACDYAGNWGGERLADLASIKRELIEYYVEMRDHAVNMERDTSVENCETLLRYANERVPGKKHRIPAAKKKQSYDPRKDPTIIELENSLKAMEESARSRSQGRASGRHLSCYLCGCEFPAHQAYRREVNTGNSSRTYYGRRGVSFSSGKSSGLRTLCPSCGRSHDFWGNIKFWIGAFAILLVAVLVFASNKPPQKKQQPTSGTVHSTTKHKNHHIVKGH